MSFKTPEKIRTANRDYYKRNPEKIKASNRASYERNKERTKEKRAASQKTCLQSHRVQRNERKKEKYRTDPEYRAKVQAKSRKYAKTHKEYFIEYHKAWEKSHPEKRKVYMKKAQEKRKRRYDSDSVFRAKVIGWQLENTRKRNKQQQNKILEIIRKRGSCEKCGFSDIRALQIHHHFGNRSKDNYDKGRKEIINGTVPYSILCANCHTILHNPRRVQEVNQLV